MKHKIAGFILIFFAMIKVVADLHGSTKISAVAAVTNTAPAMKVFTTYKGYEGFSAKFKLKVTYTDHSQVSVMLTPDVYSGLEGPYNRRNVYGALIAGGPVLISNEYTKDAWQEVAYKSFCKQNKILSELGLSSNKKVHAVEIEYILHTENPENYPETLGVTCNE